MLVYSGGASSDGKNGELLALKRISWPSSSNQRNGGGSGSGPSRKPNDNRNGPLVVRSSVKFPENVRGQSMRVTVKVVSDSYPGMEWTLSDVEVNAGVSGTQTLPESSAFPEKS